jgi:hypothetical protein
VDLTGDMVYERAQHVIALLPDGDVLVAGSYPGGGASAPTGETWSPLTGAWTEAASSMQTGRDGAASCLLPDGRVVIGGGNDSTQPYLASVDVYDPSTREFRPGPSMSESRSLHPSLLLATGETLVAGGGVPEGTRSTIETAHFFRTPGTGPAITAIGGSTAFPAAIGADATVTLSGTGLGGALAGCLMPLAGGGGTANTAGASEVIDLGGRLTSLSASSATLHVPAEARGFHLLFVRSGEVWGAARIVRIDPSTTTQPPTITSLAATPAEIFPPNGAWVPVTIVAAATGGSGSLTWTIESIASSDGSSDGWRAVSGLSLELRAARSGRDKDGRTYTISVRVTDGSGRSTTGIVTVRALHDRRK